VEITVLRSGVPRSFPGRAVDVGIGGLGLVVAVDLFVGEPVGVVLSLVESNEPIRTRGRVSYQDRVRGGIQFILPSRGQSDLIHNWAVRTQATPISRVEFQPPAVEAEAPRFLNVAPVSESVAEPRTSWALRVPIAVAVLGVALVVGGIWAWQANRKATIVPHSVSTRVIVPSEIMRAQVVARTVPGYPEAARRGGIEGVVALAVVIDKTGRVTEVRPISGPALLAAEASKAVKQWRFAPFLVAGEPMEVETTIDVGFRLTDN
jgi:TonB family protein